MATNAATNNGRLDTAWCAGGIVLVALLVLITLNLFGLTVNVGVRVG